MLEDAELIEIEEEKFKLYFKYLISSILFNEDISHIPETSKNHLESEIRQRIFFGAPGTGKSFTLNNERKRLFNDEDCERVTFHPDYSYANFVGTYKPVPLEDDEEKITYKYIEGPFLRLLVKAWKNIKSDEETKPFLLIIEEINRANVSAVFGDIFQLLDRDANNWSEFPIDTSKDMRNYLERELKKYGVNCEKLYLPSNFFIWATMNSADQGVFMMDTAFKRRWDFTYLKINNKQEDINPEWNIVRKAINKQLLKYNINEDKLLGPFFIPLKQLPKNINNIFKDDEFKRVFKNKVIMYLFEDAAKPRRNLLFKGSKKNEDFVTYSKIIKDFEKIGYKIFSDEIIGEIEEEFKKLEKEGEKEKGKETDSEEYKEELGIEKVGEEKEEKNE
ncbi:MAG: AAA family ATPase [Methanobrevibacter sp.]|nr:AAA family ATPase [Methanobrevibacter sp.]